MNIKAFRALRPKKNKTPQVASPPYDVVDRRMAKEIIQSEPNSFMQVLRPDALLPPDTPSCDPSLYKAAKKALCKLQREEILKRDPNPSIYLYRQVMNERSQIGVVACVSTKDYKNGLIKKHEQTRRAKEEDRTNHIVSLEANTGPVFLTYKDQDSVNKLIDNDISERSLFHFVDENDVTHTGWKVLNPDLYIDAFSKSNSFYIADGHHRAASAARACDLLKSKAEKNNTNTEIYDWFLAVLFPSSKLQIFPYNRIVTGISGLSSTQILESLKNIGSISAREKDAPIKKGCVGIFINKKWHMIKLDQNYNNSSQISENLDVAKVQNLFLNPILGIKNPREDSRLSFIGGIDSEKKIECSISNNKTSLGIAFAPTDINDLFFVADAGDMMPPKSTWFEPKLKSGLFVHLFDNLSFN